MNNKKSFIATLDDISNKNEELSYIKGKIDRQREIILKEEQKLNELEMQYLKIRTDCSHRNVYFMSSDTLICTCGWILRLSFKNNYVTL